MVKVSKKPERAKEPQRATPFLAFCGSLKKVLIYRGFSKSHCKSHKKSVWLFEIGLRANQRATMISSRGSLKKALNVGVFYNSENVRATKEPKTKVKWPKQRAK